jgi:TetR/AcrR family transcriptional regulator, transcriptional repressor of aconitase
MPKVTEEHKERRRQEILEGARRCFARHGYEGATVARLEEEIGLSRGAIFNYFESKEALFLAVAASLSYRMTEIWLEHGFRTLLDAIVAEDTDWLAVQLEAIRRIRTEPAFRAQAEALDEETAAGRPERMAKLREHGLREDMPIEVVATFLSLVANGLALRVTVGDQIPDLDLLAELVETGVSARGRGNP